MGIDEGERAVQNGVHMNIFRENADKSSSNELERLQSVNLTPTSPSSQATCTKTDPTPETDKTDERPSSSPPIVLKSAPSTPSAKPARLNELAENPSPLDSMPTSDPNAKAPSDGPEEDMDDPRALVISSYAPKSQTSFPK
jgi:hypothetical protein